MLCVPGVIATEKSQYRVFSLDKTAIYRNNRPKQERTETDDCFFDDRGE